MSAAVFDAAVSPQLVMLTCHPSTLSHVRPQRLRIPWPFQVLGENICHKQDLQQVLHTHCLLTDKGHALRRTDRILDLTAHVSNRSSRTTSQRPAPPRKKKSSYSPPAHSARNPPTGPFPPPQSLPHPLPARISPLQETIPRPSF